MKIKTLVLSLMSGVLLASTAYAANDDQQTDELIKKINSRTQSLEQQVKELQQQIYALKHKQGQLKNQAVANKTAIGQTTKDKANSLAETFLGGTPVVTSPYFGAHSEFDGSDLIVNMSSINQDLRLLQQWQMLDSRLQAAGKSYPQAPTVELSGKVESQAIYQMPYVGRNTADIDLTDLELDASIGVNRWVSGFMAINYDNNPLSTAAARTNNSRLYVNKAFATIGNLNDFPVYMTVGQFAVPFGQYSSFMISSPLTLPVGKVKARAVELGYHPKADEGLYGAVFAFKGDSSTQNNTDRVNNFGANAAYDFVGQNFKFTLGASYINNMADASGMQNNGLGATTFGGFGANSATEVLQHRVPGVDVQGKLSACPIVVLGEYLTATRSFDSTDLMFNNNGAKPSAMNLETAYIFNITDKPASFAIGYGQTQQALALGLPHQRYAATLSASFWKDTIASLEYRHDIAYGVGDAAGGKGYVIDFSNPLILGQSADTITAQFGIYF